jgi:AcrR family transcriptional regulator
MPSSSSVWLTPPATASPGLSRAALVRAAVTRLDADGLDRFSMRRVAADLGVTVGALYWYVATKDELLELALDDVLGEAEHAPGARDWRAALVGHASALRAVLLRHPWALPLLSRLPNIGPNAMRLADAALAIAAGFSDPPAVVAALHDQVVGAVVAQAGAERGLAAPSRTATDPAERADRRFAFALDCLLDGLAARLPD